MRWADIKGQPQAVRFLRRALGAGRLPGLLLFAGEEGVGKRTAARALAAAFLCEGGEIGSPREEACVSCVSCREFAAGVHPDLIEPEIDEESRSIPAAVARELAEMLRRTPGRGRGRVALVPRADRMNETAQNGLLKTLEEPVADTLWVLTAEDASRLLPTVRSRAMKVRFNRLPAKLMAEELARAGVSPEEARRAASAAEGSLTRARELAGSGMDEDRAFLGERVLGGRAKAAGIARLMAERAKATAEGGKGLEPVRRSTLRLLDSLAAVLRERMFADAAAGADASADALKVVLDSQAAVRQNVRTEIALAVTAVRLARIGL